MTTAHDIDLRRLVEDFTHRRQPRPAAHKQVEAFRDRPLDAGPYTFVAADALVLKIRENGRVVNVHTLVAVGVNADGYREVLGVEVTSAEDGAMEPIMAIEGREMSDGDKELLVELIRGTKTVDDVPRIIARESGYEID